MKNVKIYNKIVNFFIASRIICTAEVKAACPSGNRILLAPSPSGNRILTPTECANVSKC